MSKRYPGNFITGNPVALSQTSNAGVWDLKDNYQATGNNTWQESDGIYEISRSLRFRNSASAYLSRTPYVASNQKTFTYSAWIKRGGSSVGGVGAVGGGYIFVAGTGTNARFQIDFYYDNIEISQNDGAWTVNCVTIPFYKDPSAWYHIVVAIDTTQAVPLNRVKLYVNGVLQTLNPSGLALPSQNYNFYTNSITRHDLGQSAGASGGFFDGYMAEVNFIDGQALDPSYFGYTDSITSIWQPKAYTGAYGTNGFYLPFNEPVATSGTVNGQVVGRNFAGGTNYIRYSQDGSQTSYGYTYNNATNTVNNTVAPDGTTTGNKLTADGTSAVTHRFYCGTVATPSGSTQTASIYLKYNNCQYVNIENWNYAPIELEFLNEMILLKE
jgi:hypothetical protein